MPIPNRSGAIAILCPPPSYLVRSDHKNLWLQPLTTPAPHNMRTKLHHRSFNLVNACLTAKPLVRARSRRFALLPARDPSRVAANLRGGSCGAVEGQTCAISGGQLLPGSTPGDELCEESKFLIEKCVRSPLGGYVRLGAAEAAPSAASTL